MLSPGHSPGSLDKANVWFLLRKKRPCVHSPIGAQISPCKPETLRQPLVHAPAHAKQHNGKLCGATPLMHMKEKDILNALNAEWKEFSFCKPTTGSQRTMVVLVRKPAGGETSAPQQV